MRAFLAALVLLCLAACGAQLSAPADPELDALFAELQTAQNPEAARPIEERIWRRWADPKSATVAVLLERAANAENAGDPNLAFQFLDEASELAPNFAEPWRRRAVLAYDQEDYAGAIRAIEETLRREPRHFAAYLGLGLIYENLGRTESALKAFNAALAIHPNLEEAQRGVARLAPRVDGTDA